MHPNRSSVAIKENYLLVVKINKEIAKLQNQEQQLRTK